MITVTGSLAFDHIMDFPGKFSDHIMPDKIHQINLSFLVNTLKKQRGGTAGNIAYTLALLDQPVSILSAAGKDFLEYANFLKESGVDISRIRIVPDTTSSAFIMTDLADNQITAFYPGAMEENTKLYLDKNTDFVIISPNDPAAMKNFARQCQDFNTPYMLDPCMQLPALETADLKHMLAKAAILIGNDYEIALLNSKLTVQVDILITTLGEKGSVIQTKDQNIQINPAKPKLVVDPTGAGDGFRAGFVAGYIKGLDLKSCGQMGSVAACYAIEKYGTTNHCFSIEEFRKRYKDNFGDELPY